MLDDRRPVRVGKVTRKIGSVPKDVATAEIPGVLVRRSPTLWKNIVLKGIVIGPAVSTVKHASMNRQKLLLVQPLMADGQRPDGDPLVSIDAIGAGVGQTVVLTSDGRYARQVVDAKATPVRWTVLGIEDAVAARLDS